MARGTEVKVRLRLLKAHEAPILEADREAFKDWSIVGKVVQPN